MPEVFRKDKVDKQLHILNHKAISFWVPSNHGCVFWRLDIQVNTQRIEYVLSTKVAIGTYVSFCIVQKAELLICITQNTICQIYTSIISSAKLNQNIESKWMIFLGNEEYILLILASKLIIHISCMPKVENIIQQFERECPDIVPQITQVFESDPERINEALKERGKDSVYYAFMRILNYKTLKMLHPNNPKDFLRPLLEINLGDLRGKALIEATLSICEGIIEAGDFYRTNTIDKYMNDLQKLNLSNLQYARLEAISAGNNFLKGDYGKAAWQYFSACRMQAFVKDEATKIYLVQKAISFAFITPIGSQSHKIICSLCLSEVARKSKLYELVNKMYKEDIVTKADIAKVQSCLPTVLSQKDQDGVSIIQQSAFSRNMIPIINSFSTIKLQTLLRLSEVTSLDQLLILIEKTYCNGEVSIDQVKEIVNIKQQTDSSEIVKEFLSQIDDILVQ